MLTTDSSDARDALEPVAKKNPGYDAGQNDCIALSLGKKSRPARWLTFLGPDALSKLGGAKGIAKKVGRNVGTLPVGKGVALRAGAEPSPKPSGPSRHALEAVARAIEPVRYSDDS